MPMLPFWIVFFGIKIKIYLPSVMFVITSQAYCWYATYCSYATVIFCGTFSKNFFAKQLYWNYKKNLQSNFIEITLQHRCSPVNLLHIFRTPFPSNIFFTAVLICLWLNTDQLIEWLIKSNIWNASSAKSWDLLLW